MNERDKIEAVIEEYKEYLKNTNSDVCYSYKGVRFFYQHDCKNKNY